MGKLSYYRHPNHFPHGYHYFQRHLLSDSYPYFHYSRLVGICHQGLYYWHHTQGDLGAQHPGAGSGITEYQRYLFNTQASVVSWQLPDVAGLAPVYLQCLLRHYYFIVFLALLRTNHVCRRTFSGKKIWRGIPQMVGRSTRFHTRHH